MDPGANLSGGQKQRVAIARALYLTNRHDVNITVMDDPMSALDAKVRRNLFNSLKGSGLKGYTRPYMVITAL